jgi:hypothetical protein
MPEPENSSAETLNPEPENTTPDASTVDNTAELADAKIAELTLVIAAKDQRIAELTAEVQAAKAANYDLLMATPQGGDENPDDPDNTDDSEFDAEDVSIEDILYAKE